MNKDFLKSIRDIMPEPMKYLLAPFIRNKLVKNREFKAYYSLLEKRKFLSQDEIKDHQLKCLKKTLIHAAKYVPYYRELFSKIGFDPAKFTDFDQLSQIPCLTREIIIENFDKLISTRNIKNGYYVGKTGGSSGLPLKFYLDFDSVYKENAFIYYYRKKLGYRFEDKLVTFRQFDIWDKLWKLNPMHNELIFTPMKLSKVTIGAFAKKANEFNPQYLNGYLSAIWYFAKLLEEYQIKLNLNLKGIFLISENPDLEQRDFIEKYFKVKSMTFYGHSERCVIAEETSPYKYVFDPFYGYTEQIHIEEDRYAIVGTGFLNSVMPFIRYKTDDICIPENGNFAIEGKRSSTMGLYGYHNEFLPNTSFLLRNPVYKNITAYQFVQNEKGKADLLIILNKHFQDYELELVKKEIRNQTKGIIDLEIKVVERLILSPRGKYQMFISNIAKNE